MSLFFIFKFLKLKIIQFIFKLKWTTFSFLKVRNGEIITASAVKIKTIL
jgi:hypothetical protein